jgi:cobalamin biosynthesis Mg chelatase CobN
MAKRAPQEEEVGESDDGMGWPAKKGAPAEKPKKNDTGKVKRPSAEGDAAKAKPKGASKGDTGKNPAVKSSAVKEKEPKENLKASGKRKTSGVRKAADGEEGGEGDLSASARRRRERPQSKTNWALIGIVGAIMIAFTVFAIWAQKDAHGPKQPPPAATEAPKPAPAPATEEPKKE